MSDAVLVALITGLAAVASNWLITRSNREKDKAERAKLDQKTDDRLKAIEHKLDEHNRKLDEHNGYAQRFAEIGADIRVIRNEIEHLQKQ